MRDFVARLTFEGGATLEFHGPADITKETTVAIVNAANSSLMGGGGVDGAIHRAGGPSILEECQRIIAKIGSLPAGKAAMTTGGRLSAKYVIHTVGPRYRGGSQNEAKTLASCYRESLRIADEHEVESVAFPSVSTGIYGYPIEAAAGVAIAAIAEVLPALSHTRHVRFVLFDHATCAAYVNAAEDIPLRHKSAVFEKGKS
jgi:O-acetyl-ADP-ribose deacetylase (regulator of RNase III)